MDLRFIIMLLVGMSWADVLSVMLTSDIRAKRRPSDWRRAPGISAEQAVERDLVVRGVGTWRQT